MLVFARYAPAALSGPVIWLVSLYFTLVPSRAAAEGADLYFRAVLGRRPGFTERHRQIRTFAHVVIERVGLLSDRLDGFDIRLRGEEAIAALHAEGRGAVLLGAHFGSFEALRAAERKLPGLSVRYMMFEDNAGNTASLLRKVNPALAGRVIALRDGIGAMLDARAALGSGDFVAFLGDRMARRNKRAEVEVDFLGRRLRLPRAPYLSAMLAEVPLILCFSPRTGRRTYDIVFSELHDGAAVPRGERDAKCAELAQRYADALADMCRRHPYNWFNFFNIWR